MTQESSHTQKMMFHIIHALHLAGRCTECGECERVCPMDIPLGKLKKKINMDMKELFDYVPGSDPDSTPPLFTFKVDEDKIEEHTP
jgi:ferredoxin